MALKRESRSTEVENSKVGDTAQVIDPTAVQGIDDMQVLPKTGMEKRLSECNGSEEMGINFRGLVNFHLLLAGSAQDTGSYRVI